MTITKHKLSLTEPDADQKNKYHGVFFFTLFKFGKKSMLYLRKKKIMFAKQVKCVCFSFLIFFFEICFIVYVSWSVCGVFVLRVCFSMNLVNGLTDKPNILLCVNDDDCSVCVFVFVFM